MNYEELKFVIRYIKKFVTCSKCESKFTDQNINILATLPVEAVFQINCAHCKHMMFVNIGIQHENNENKVISKRDIETMHKFLEKFNGDFKSLFKT